MIDVRSMKNLVLMAGTMNVAFLQPAPTGFLGRNRVIAATAPGMTTADAFERQPGSGQGAVRLKRFQRVLRAAWIEPATGERAQQQIL